METLAISTVRIQRNGSPCLVFDAEQDRGFRFETGESHAVSLSLGRELLADPSGWAEVFDGGLVTTSLHPHG